MSTRTTKVRRLKSKERIEELFAEVDGEDWDVILLTETWREIESTCMVTECAAKLFIALLSKSTFWVAAF